MKKVPAAPPPAPPTEEDVAHALERRQALLQAVGTAYAAQLDEQMGLLHNQFVAFISEAKLPLPQVLLVLEMLVNETIAQARAKYVGGG
jgi:hypothetical protein